MYINEEKIKEIIEKTAHTRTSGTKKELECALYIKGICNELGLDATLEDFPVRVYKEKKASLTIDGTQVLCKSWHGTGSGKISGELYFLEGDDEISLSGCKDKIVLCVKTFKDFYNKLYRYGAKAIITYSGNFHHANKDVDLKILSSVKDENNNLPCVNINIKDAFRIINNGCKHAEFDVQIKESVGKSHNLYLDIKGNSDKTVIVSAHYDSTSLSKGSYDNMSSCVALLYLADYFKNTKPLHTLRLLWCGSEEAGLVGSRAYCKYHSEDLKNTILNINLDMLGCVMGSFSCFSCADESMESYMKQLCLNEKFSSAVTLAIRSSDSNSFVQRGVPAVSFARYGACDTAVIHTRYDTPETISTSQLVKDCRFIACFTSNAVNGINGFPEKVLICDKIKKDVDAYFKNKLDIL